jgi:hypothetical protein
MKRREALARLHQAVKNIAGHLSNVVTLVGRYPSEAQALTMLDHHAQSPNADPGQQDPECAAWLSTLEGIRRNLDEARRLWSEDETSPGVGLHLDFTRTSGGGVKCGPIERGTHHEVVIAVARLMLNPLDPGAIWQNELGALDVQVGDRDVVCRQARVDVARALKSRPLWHALTLGLQREFAEVIHGREKPPSDVEHESGELARRPHGSGHALEDEAPAKAVAATRQTPAVDGPEQKDNTIDSPAEGGQPEFSRIERAIALLLREGRNGRSMRDFAKLVGIHHSGLSRSEQWQRAWKASKPEPAELPHGVKEVDGNVDAWKVEVCENCRQEPVTGTVEVNGEVVRVCEACAVKLTPRTK